MPVQLTQREREIFTAAREFALAQFAPHAAEWEEGRTLPATGVEAARRQGFFGVSCPKEVGGKGYDFLETALTYEGLAHGDGGFAFFVQLHNNITFEIATYYDTSDEVKALVPDMVSGKSLTAFALTEKDAGCDPAMSTAYAEEREDGYHIFGEKTWTSDSIDARHFNVIVKDGTPKGMLMLLVDRGTKGFEILEDRRRIGGNAMTCGTLRFSDCVVPKSRLLSADGFREALRAIDVARIFVPAIAVGVAQRAIDITADYLAKRVTFGTPILKNQAIQWELAEMTAEVEAARWLVYHAASKMDAGEPIAETAAMAKLIAPNTCMKVTTECAQLFGALGCEWNSEISRAMNMAKVMKVVDGSTEIQKIVLGRAIERRAFPQARQAGKVKGIHMPKIMTADEAALLLHSGDTVLFNGFGSLGFPEGLSEAVGRRFAASGQPRDLEMIFSAGQGVWNEERMVEHMCQPGMVRKVVGGHITPNLRICQQLQNNEIEGYNFSMGVISHLIRESAGGHPGLVTKIGLKTFIDPRYGGGALNERSKAEMVKLIELDGEEYLFYPAIRPSVAILRGTTCDPNGNITMEKEAVIGDAYHCALAARRTGGRVIVQVERLTDAPAHPRSVVIPGVFVDAVVVDPGQLQTMIEAYDPAYTGEIRVPQDQVLPLIERVNDLNVQAGRKRERGPLHQVIARRAAMELTSGALVNLGIGIPELIPQGAKDLGLPGDITLTVESGCIGGVPAPGISFGAAVNPHMVQDMASQFDLYDGGLLDMTFVGAMQVGQDGSVNVSKAGSRIIGVGGFTDLTQSARKLTYCFPFSSGGLEVEIRDGAVKILKEGKWPKFCQTLDQISASGPYSLEIGQQVLYITERCVFDLTSQGLRLIEIAPGVDLERDILSRMPYRPVVAEGLKQMDPRLFRGL